ncbi:MAG: hypothetical protein N3G18_02185 [Candidatus Saccharicenans sp.]|nr:hypothetical protein [Candidatus Saccharicenans sp.]
MIFLFISISSPELLNQPLSWASFLLFLDEPVGQQAQPISGSLEAVAEKNSGIIQKLQEVNDSLFAVFRQHFQSLRRKISEARKNQGT